MYKSTSPYYNTIIVNNQFLDIMADRHIPKNQLDTYWTITPTYEYRPDLLANDIYDDSSLWWVFAARNPNRIKDPLFDFVAGTSIYLPQLNSLREALGL
jgi:hypothetical protein